MLKNLVNSLINRVISDSNKHLESLQAPTAFQLIFGAQKTRYFLLL